MPWMKLLPVLAIGVLESVLQPVCAEEIMVAVASNFAAPMTEIAETFEGESGHELVLSTGSSGRFYAQVRNGAPYQVFLSADQQTPAKLEADGMTVAGSRFTYAIGALALWSADPDIVDGQGAVLRQDRFNKLALANPDLAPYGAAAIEILQNLGLESETRPKWVQGENIAQTYQFVATGNADLGFVALSQILDDGEITKGSAWIVPDELYAPVRQDAVLLRRGADSEGARALLDFLRGDQARQIITRYGYRVTPVPGWKVNDVLGR